MFDSFLLRRLLLTFDREDDDLTRDLSATATTPDGSLWLGSDELRSVERLSPLGNGSYGAHRTFHLGEFVDLFDNESEIDIEGMDYSQGYLWVVGSHSWKRDKPKGKNVEKDLARIAEIELDSNRYLLARIPVMQGDLVPSCAREGGDESDRLTAAMLEKAEFHNVLMEALREDEHLGAFVGAQIPSKDNGLDIEGLAVCGDRVFLGLRGPVLRGWAVVLELQTEDTEPGEFTLKDLGDGQLYRKHFVDLDGLGVRELCLQGDDLLILAGATMDLDGAMRLFRLEDLLDRSEDAIWDGDSGALSRLFDLPYAVGCDRAEGLALMPCFDRAGLLVVYDAPAPERIRDERSLYVDIFRLPD